MKLVVGLGNPGKKYEGTRHNVGFEVFERAGPRVRRRPAAEEVRRRSWRVSAGRRKSVAARPADIHEPQRPRACGRPSTFTRSPTKTCWWFATSFNCPWGSCGLRPHGTDGGQNGLADVIRVLGTKEFPGCESASARCPTAGTRPILCWENSRQANEEIIDVEIARAADAVQTVGDRGHRWPR